MARFYGQVGYADTKETKPDVWTPTITEYSYYGDVLRDLRKLDGRDRINDDVDLNNRISIVADPYAYEHYHLIRYVVLDGVKWKVTNVEVQRPRLILTVGGLYNGNAN